MTEEAMFDPIAVVDEQNHFVRWENRRVVHEQRLLHRSSYVLVFDQAGRMLVQLRKADKDTYPSHWDLSVAGHVEPGDYGSELDGIQVDWAYRAAARRELHEELGVLSEPLGIDTFWPDTIGGYAIVKVFRVVLDGETASSVKFQESEIQSIQWLDRWSLGVMCQESNATPALLYFARYSAQRGWLR